MWNIKKTIIFMMVLFLLIGCSRTEKELGTISNEQMPLLKIFGESQLIGKINHINNQAEVNITIINLEDYKFLESKEQLIQNGDSIIIHFTGVGNKEEWKTKLLSKDMLFSTKIRCLDGRINSRELFTKEKCFWESNEEAIILK